LPLAPAGHHRARWPARRDVSARPAFEPIALAGITAGGYLAWAGDPEPPGLGRELTSVDVRADPLGETVELWLSRPSRHPRATRRRGPRAAR
jgi:hypothetical protein